MHSHSPRILLAGAASARPAGLERALTRAGFQIIEHVGETCPPDALLITLESAEQQRLAEALAGDAAPPRIVVFAAADPDAPAAALALGADDALSVPLHLPELCARLHARIRDRQAPSRTPYESRVREALRHLVIEAGAALQPDEIATALVRRLARAFDLTYCSLVATAPPQDAGRILAATDDRWAGRSALDLTTLPEILEAVRTRRAVLMPGLPGSSETALTVLPIAAGDEVARVLLLQPAAEAPGLTAAQLDLAGSVAAAAARAWERSAGPSHNGGPGGAPGTLAAAPGSLERRLREEYERARRYSLSFSLILLDLAPPVGTPEPDRELSHDALLEEIHSRLRQTLRLPDYVARYTGSELAIVLPETGPEGARRSVVRMREGLAGLGTGSEDGDRHRFTIGIASYPHPAVHQADDMVALVEAALMRGKAGEGVGVAE